MKKYVSTLVLLVSAASANAAVDNFDPNTSILTIPYVTLGSTTYQNVVVQLNSMTVLAAQPTQSLGLVIYEDANMRINMAGSSRNPASQSSNGIYYYTVSFNLLITNKTASNIYIAGADTSSQQSTLLDNLGTLCSSTGSSISPVPQGISTIYSGSNLLNISLYTIINPGTSLELPVNSNFCSWTFAGNIFTYRSYFQVYNKSTNTSSLLPFGFTNVALP